METSHWHLVQSLFCDAAELPEPERLPFLKSRCNGDENLLNEISALLEEDSQGNAMLDGGLADAAQNVFGPAAHDFFNSREFGPYRIGRVLGEGGMGVVYLAEREDLGNPVAIKLLRDAWLSPARRQRFMSEQRTLAQLNHAAIARLYDANTLADGTPWFAMEYVEGLPLTEYCLVNHWAVDCRLRLFRHVCEAVQYAHGLAVIHRDLKPSNILVKSDGTVKLLDFGISKQLKLPESALGQTRTAFRLLTPQYAAPEQIRGEPVGTRADVYSLGIILYELLTGRLPFDVNGRAPGEIEKAVLKQEPEKPSAVARRIGERGGPQLSRSLWGDLDVLCLSAMHKDPERRYGSVEALMRDIDHYLENEPLDARPDSTRYRVSKFIERNRRAVSATAAVLTTVLAMAIFFTVKLAAARNAALAQATRAQRIQRFMLSMFEGGDEDTAPASDLRVATLLDRGMQEARMLDKEPEIQADLYQLLGGMYQDLGSLQQADSLLRAALEKRQSLFGRDHPESAKSLTALGVLRSNQGKFKEAEQLVREALAIEKRRPGANPAMAGTMGALGFVLEHRGAYEEAVRVLEQAVRQEQLYKDASPELAFSLMELGNAYFYLGRYEASDSVNRRALGLLRQLHGEYYPLNAKVLINLGAIQSNDGHYAEAERLYRQTLDINQHWYGWNHPETASSLTVIGQVLVQEKRYAEAEDLLKQALAIQEHVYGPTHFRVALALNELGRSEYACDQLDEAEIHFRRALDIYRRMYSDKHYYVAIALGNLGGIYLDRKQYGKAEQVYREMIGRLLQTLPATHVHTGMAQVKLGRSLLRQGRYREAESHTLTGYQILMQQARPPADFVRAARKDLAAEYDALKEPLKAQEFRSQSPSPMPQHSLK
jgi:eukaryotic-like serine/threonine-protein kinase